MIELLVAAILAVASIGAPATVEVEAVRLEPPAPTLPAVASPVPGRCVQWEPVLAELSPGWPVERMSRIMYRESRCQPDARNRSSSATGLLQILASHCPWLAAQLGTWCTRERLTDPYFNILAGAALYREQGIGAWSTA